MDYGFHKGCHSGESRNPVFSKASGCRIESGMTKGLNLWRDTNYENISETLNQVQGDEKVVVQCPLLIC